MDRRAFLRGWIRPSNTALQATASQQASVRPLATGLEPYAPDATQPWDTYRAAHLLRRAMFMPKWSEIAQIAMMTPSEAVDLLLNTPSTPEPPSIVDSETESLDGLDTQSQNIVRSRWSSDAAALRKWMVEVMTDSPLSIYEKMTLFWSGHFTTEFVADQDYVVAPLLYRQNKLIRENGLKNLKDLVLNITLDGAMLTYLGGNLNSAGKPNENYARELLELFTTGLGWYTEGDVQNAARILTGWRIATFYDKPKPNGAFTTYFIPAAHDTNGKQFLGESFPARDVSTNTEFIVRRDEVKKLVDTIFERRAEAVAKFISRKIYLFFVYSNPSQSDQGVIQAMADLMIKSDFEIKPVVAALLKSQHFFDNANIGAQIKTPAELTIGFCRQLVSPTKPVDKMAPLGQELFDPPNVSGWPGYHDWVTTSTFPRRSELAQEVVSLLDDTLTIAFIKQFPEYTNASKLIDSVALLLLPRKLSTARKAALMDTLLGGSPDYEWQNILSGSPSTAVRHMKDVISRITELPDFQLS
jgi:uncharacterized protein (DUF1800 family)